MCVLRVAHTHAVIVCYVYDPQEKRYKFTSTTSLWVTKFYLGNRIS